MSDDNTKSRYRSASGSSLPLVSVIDDPDLFKKATKLLKEAVACKVKQSEAEDRVTEIKDELAAICAAYDLKGIRHGLNGFEYHGYTSRKSLDKKKLLNFISADDLASCYVEGDPYLNAKVVPFDLE
jgi:hypothetical protein